MSAAPNTSGPTTVPLAVDLDGTLIRTDLMWESLARLLRHQPLALCAVPFWWMRGRAYLKQQLAARVKVDASTLPYHAEFLEWLKLQKKTGRKIVLATASDIKMAEPVARHVGLFDEVLASDGITNLRDNAKLAALTKAFGERGFDYAGNSSVDLDVWKGSREAIVVNAGESLARRAAGCAKLGPTFPNHASPFGALIRCLRPHQWIKNLIVLVPVLTAHQLDNPAVLGRALLACVSFCLCASAAYLLNDLTDLDADRQHAGKRTRPFAAGNLPLAHGFIVPPLLLLAGMIAAGWLSPTFAGVMTGYFVGALAYSWCFKTVVVLDVFVLAGLYTMRLVGGHAATNIAWSAWLLGFSMFIFLSLALMKRVQELLAVRESDEPGLKGRGYTGGDLELISTLGVVSGFLAVLVLALYVNSDQVRTLYAHPGLLLLVCPLLLFWIARVWLLAHRGQMHEDPTVFALKDWVSYVVGALTLGVMWFATGR